MFKELFKIKLIELRQINVNSNSFSFPNVTYCMSCWRCPSGRIRSLVICSTCVGVTDWICNHINAVTDIVSIELDSIFAIDIKRGRWVQILLLPFINCDQIIFNGLYFLLKFHHLHVVNVNQSYCDKTNLNCHFIACFGNNFSIGFLYFLD